MAEISPFRNAKACVFDAYGTLFDVRSVIGKLRDRLGKDAVEVTELWRVKQLEYTWLRSLMHRHVDFWQVTQEALDYALDTVGAADRGFQGDLMEAYLQLDCYPEVPETLRRLKESGFQVAILSNGSPRMLDAVVNSCGLEGYFEPVLSVEEVGVFKPDPRVYGLAVERLDVGRDEIVFLSSNSWDVAGAASFGLRVVWVNRFGQRPERLPADPDAEIPSLAELPELLSS